MRENTPLLVDGVVAAGDIMFWSMLIHARHNFISLQRTFHGWLGPVGRLAAHCACADQFPSRKTEKLCGDDCGPRKSAPAPGRGVLAAGSGMHGSIATAVQSTDFLSPESALRSRIADYQLLLILHSQSTWIIVNIIKNREGVLSPPHQTARRPI